EDVGERQEQQRRGVVGLEQQVQLGDRYPELGHEVPVGELAALRTAGRPGGVDDRRQVERGGPGPPVLENVVGDVLAQAAQDLDPVVRQRPHVVQVGQAGA